MDAPSIVKFDKGDNWILLQPCSLATLKDMLVYAPFKKYLFCENCFIAQMCTVNWMDACCFERDM